MPDKRPKYDQHNPSQNSLQRWDNEGGATQRSRAQHPRDFSQADKLVEDISTGRVENRPPTPEEQGNDSRFSFSGTVLVAPILAPFLFRRDTVFDMTRRHRPTAGLFERKRRFLPYPHPAIVLSCAAPRAMAAVEAP